uniref:Uncharacterized protein n=1 Tax=Oryza barthii TaxID=65489 RepID=A0A0D3H3C1_9ORYZ
MPPDLTSTTWPVSTTSRIPASHHPVPLRPPSSTVCRRRISFLPFITEGHLYLQKMKLCGINALKNSMILFYFSLVGDLKEVVVHIQRDIKTVGDSMSIKMQYLQSTANDIANVVGKSLENHMQLLDGQSKAMVSLINL